MYFISKRLTEAKTRYPKLEKLAYTLLIASRKLRLYFQAHSIKVLTNQPIRQVLHRPEASERLLKWSIELSQFDIIYQPRATIKEQALADFVVECMGYDDEKDDPMVNRLRWQLYVDGASNDHDSRVGIVLITPEGRKIWYTLKLDFGATNNEMNMSPSSTS